MGNENGNCDRGQMIFALDQNHLTLLTPLVDPYFALFDSDDNGVISIDEIDTLMRSFDDDEFVNNFDFNKVWNVANAFFDVCDTDNSGACSWDEITGLVRDIAQPWMPLITNKNGEFG